MCVTDGEWPACLRCTRRLELKTTEEDGLETHTVQFTLGQYNCSIPRILAPPSLFLQFRRQSYIERFGFTGWSSFARIATFFSSLGSSTELLYVYTVYLVSWGARLFKPPESNLQTFCSELATRFLSSSANGHQLTAVRNTASVMLVWFGSVRGKEKRLGDRDGSLSSSRIVFRLHWCYKHRILTATLKKTGIHSFALGVTKLRSHDTRFSMHSIMAATTAAVCIIVFLEFGPCIISTRFSTILSLSRSIALYVL